MHYLPDNPSNGRIVRQLIRYARPHFKEYIIGGLLAVVFSAVSLLTPLVIRSVIERFEKHTIDISALWSGFIALMSIAIVSALARYGERMLMIRASRKIEFDLRNDYFQHIQRLGQDFFHRTKTGDIIARITNDLNYVRMLLGPGVMGTVDMITLPFALGMMIHFSVHLTMVTLLPLPFVSIVVYLLVMYMHRQSNRVQAQFSVITSRAQENLSGARVVKAFGLAEREVATFRHESQIYMRENIKLSSAMALLWPLVGLVIGTTTLLVIWRGGFMVIDGALTMGDLFGFLICLFSLAWPLAQLGWVLTLYQRGAVGMTRMLEVLNERPSIANSADTLTGATVSAGAVRFEQVYLSHDGQEILHDISFTIESGKTLAIVGPTGSGKTSIISLLTRQYDPTNGQVFIDEINARSIPLKSLRQAIGYVPQETFLFSDTIRANLTFGKLDADDSKINYACEVAQFDETAARMPNGYETLLGEYGVNLSGGQKQRLAIARAVLCEPKILVLDDALSSVDTHTEEQILQRLKRVMAERTSVIISHRVSTVRHADLIIVIDNGRIIERGNHDELLELGGLYNRMYERQQLEDELEQQA